MWEMREEPVARGVRLRMFEDGEPLPFIDLLKGLTNADFADWYSREILSRAAGAVFWEHPPLTLATLADPSEFVLIDAPSLHETQADRAAFETHLSGASADGVVAFPNLSGDANLVVPNGDNESPYGHLSDFLRHARPDQLRSLWRVVASELLAKIDVDPVWLSTAGMGVPWLHIRIDSRPKYYRHAAYKRPPAS